MQSFICYILSMSVKTNHTRENPAMYKFVLSFNFRLSTGSLQLTLEQIKHNASDWQQAPATKKGLVSKNNCDM